MASTEFTDTDSHHPSSRRYCFCIPYTWQKIPSSSPRYHNSNESIWTRGVTALKKLREWSEIVAGPKWKTFIRRFNRNRSFNKGNKYQYDPLNYALNFDEGLPLDNGDSEAENDYMVRNFSSRYAAVTPVRSTGVETGPNSV